MSDRQDAGRQLDADQAEDPVDAQADQGRPVFGETGEFLTRVKNRPLVFKNRPLVVKETQRVYEDLSRLERMAVKAINSKIII